MTGSNHLSLGARCDRLLRQARPTGSRHVEESWLGSRVWAFEPPERVSDDLDATVRNPVCRAAPASARRCPIWTSIGTVTAMTIRSPGFSARPHPASTVLGLVGRGQVNQIRSAQGSWPPARTRKWRSDMR